MADEAWVALGVAAMTGLCVTLWNTDGKLDWIAEYAGWLFMATFLAAIVYNFGCFVGARAAVDAVATITSAQSQAARRAVAAEQFGWPFVVTTFALGVGLVRFPELFAAMRASRSR